MGIQIKFLFTFLREAAKIFKVRLFNFQGGNLRNAIPREAKAELAVSISDKEAFIKFFKEYKNTLIDKLKTADSNIELQIMEISNPQSVMTGKSQKRFLESLNLYLESSRDSHRCD